MQTIVNWIASTFFNPEYPLRYKFNGSGDTSFHWYVLVFVLLASIVGTILWSLIYRKTNAYPKLYYWLTVFVRYYIGLMLINYGISKFDQSQFSPPGFQTLLTPIGDQSLMGMAWTFYGSSKSYNIFMGVVEVAGILLLFRRTATLGALISLATAINIMAINYFYNVPVKMVSTALVLLSLFLLAPNIIRLFQFLVLQKQTRIQSFPQLPIKNKAVKGTLIGLKYIIIVFTIAFSINSMRVMREYKALRENTKADFYGVYYISETEERYKQAMGIPNTWQRFVFVGTNTLNIQETNQEFTLMEIEVNEKTKEFKILSPPGVKGIHASYSKNSDGNITLKSLGSDTTARLTLTKMDMDKKPLKTNRFNWIIGD